MSAPVRVADDAAVVLATTVESLPATVRERPEPKTSTLAKVVTHPANPRTKLGDLSELEESIRIHGVLQDPVVMPADRVLAAWTAHADTTSDAWLAVQSADWVVLMGARRRTAAGNVLGNVPDAPLYVLAREDSIADDPLRQIDVMTAENVARTPLTPVEEARAFNTQVRAGRSQHEVARIAGCSQPHVSKRLKLLRLPAAMLTALDAGQPDPGDEDAPAGKALQIKDALAYVDAAGDEDDAQFVMLAAYKLARHRRHMTPAQLVAEVRREQARRVQREALARKAADEGVPVLDDPQQRFGGFMGAWERRLEGKKAIAAARKAGTLAAEVTDGGLVYYDTASRPKKADNRTDAEQQRITNERERRVAMTARAEAAAVLAAEAPKLPETAADIVDAWLWAPGNDVSALAQKWLIAAGVGPDRQLAVYEWWQQIRTGSWPVRVHAAHALGLARREVRARDTHREWNAADAAWVTRLTAEAGYTPTAWEQQRMAKLGAPAEPAGTEPTAAATLMLGWSVVDGWCVYTGDDPAPSDSAGVDIGRDDVDAAQRWAGETAAGLDQQVTGWRPWTDPHGQPGFAAVLADRPGDQDPTGAPVEYRLYYAADAGEWRLHAGERLLADHDCLTADAVEQALAWATAVVSDDGGTATSWNTRIAGAADASGGVEYVPDRT